MSCDLLSSVEETSPMAMLVSALFLSPKQADAAVGELMRVGYTKDDIGVMMSDATRNSAFGPAEVADSAHKTNQAAAIGGVLGMLVAGVVTVGTLAVMGPFAAVLAGVSGGLMGSAAGAVVGSARHPHPIQRVTGRVQEGGIVIGVLAEGKDREAQVKKILSSYGGEFVETDLRPDPAAHHTLSKSAQGRGFRRVLHVRGRGTRAEKRAKRSGVKRAPRTWRRSCRRSTLRSRNVRRSTSKSRTKSAGRARERRSAARTPP